MENLNFKIDALKILFENQLNKYLESHNLFPDHIHENYNNLTISIENDYLIIGADQGNQEK